MSPVRVASVQFQHVNAGKAANFAKIDAFARRAVEQGVQLVVLPECCITGYWFLRNLTHEALQTIAEPVFEGPSCQRLRALAAEYGIAIGAGLIELASDGRMFNTYVVALPDGAIYRHRKLQAFEHDRISSGDEYTVFDTPFGRVGILICYDNNLIENVRITALKGAEILLAPHQTGGCDSRSPHGMKPIDVKLWENRHLDSAALSAEFQGDKGRGWLMRWLPSRAHDNGLFLIFSNGVGRDDDEVRTGNAMILDPYGRIVAESRAIEDDMVVATLDPVLLERSTGSRWIQARRPDLYAPLVASTGNEKSTRVVRFR